MDYFRNIVVLAAIAGAIAGLGMTVMQSFATVPLIPRPRPSRDRAKLERLLPHRMSMRPERRCMIMAMAGRRKTASSAPPSPPPPIS
jgi:hypothetical protein